MDNCPVCAAADVIADFITFQYGGKAYTLSKCTDCECLFYKDEFFFDFRNNYEHNRNLKTYLEKTSDLEGLITVVYNFMLNLPASCEAGLDIGCGAGMLMDFAQSAMQKRMTGFEPSAYYSREGRETLHATIIEDFFSAEKLDAKVDFVLCLQVLQMVPDPLHLISQIVQVMEPCGSLLLSTPDNETIARPDDIAANYSTLSPGVHRVVYNHRSLSRLLSRAGFAHVQVYKKDGQLFAIASQTALMPVDLFASNREVVLGYYMDKLKSLKAGTSYFKGIWYRYFRNKMDHGEYEEALELLSGARWFEVWSEHEIEEIHTLDKLFELNSSADAVIYYYTGILFLNHLHKYAYAEKFFLLSFLLSKKMIHIQPEMCAVEQDIVWLAKYHEALVKIYQGKRKEAKSEIITFLSTGKSAAANGLQPMPGLVEKAENLLKEIA